MVNEFWQLMISLLCDAIYISSRWFGVHSEFIIKEVSFILYKWAWYLKIFKQTIKSLCLNFDVLLMISVVRPTLLSNTLLNPYNKGHFPFRGKISRFLFILHIAGISDICHDWLRDSFECVCVFKRLQMDYSSGEKTLEVHFLALRISGIWSYNEAISAWFSGTNLANYNLFFTDLLSGCDLGDCSRD